VDYVFTKLYIKASRQCQLERATFTGLKGDDSDAVTPLGLMTVFVIDLELIGSFSVDSHPKMG